MSTGTRSYVKWQRPLSRDLRGQGQQQALQPLKSSLPRSGQYQNQTDWKLDKVVFLLHEVLRYNEEMLRHFSTSNQCSQANQTPAPSSPKKKKLSPREELSSFQEDSDDGIEDV